MESRTRHVVWSVIVLLVAALLGWFVLSTNHPDSRFAVKLGLDLAGGTELIYRADTSAVQTDLQGALDSLREVIERRVNLFGVAEPLVQIERSSAVAGPVEDRLLVELPGVTDVAAAVDAIGATPILEFKLRLGVDETGALVYTDTGLSGRYLDSAELQFAQGAGGSVGSAPVIVLHFNSEGATLFETITTEHVGETLAIFLDGEVLSEPVIQEPIAGGDATITGSFTAVEAREMVRNLNFGALPVPIELVGSGAVGPTLGAEAVAAGKVAGAIGFALVALFMIAWYRLPGLIASIALVVYVIIMFAIIKTIPVTLTASGIAGLILSIGMAIDANILISERMKEELRRGIAPREAARIGFSRAWTAIRDGHFTMLISAVILFWVGTSIVQGFALVHGLGVIASLVSGVLVTRALLLAMLPNELRGAWRFLLGTGLRRNAYSETSANPQ